MECDCRVIANVAYGEHPRQICDIYLPTHVSQPLPTVLLIHGGGWHAGDRGPLASEAIWVQGGWAVARMTYRYSTDMHHPAQIDDCRAMLGLLRSRADDWGLDAARIAVAGHSAGGHLAALLGCTDPKLIAVIAAAAPMDLEALAPFHAEQHTADPDGDLIARLMGAPTHTIPDQLRAASPQAWISAETPPHLLVYADSDDLIPLAQAHGFAEAMRDLGREVQELVLPQAGHCDPRFWDAERMRYQLDFLNRCANDS